MAERIKKNYKDFYDIIGDYLGMGAFGVVYKAKLKNNENELRAIKLIDLDKIREGLIYFQEDNLEEKMELFIDGFIKEYDNMKICSENNDNSVKCYEYFINEKYFIIIMELCDTNLLKLLLERKKNKKKFNKEEILKIMNDLNNTFKIMKEKNIIHRDLKPENILIKNNKMKITDYGCSKRVYSLLKTLYSKNKGTPIYMAPEILKGEKYNYKCDLWSIGIIIYQLYFGNPPCCGLNEEVLIKDINNKIGKHLLNKTSDEKLDDLIQKLLERESSKRLNWEDYFNHPFFNNGNKIINNEIKNEKKNDEKKEEGKEDNKDKKEETKDKEKEKKDKDKNSDKEEKYKDNEEKKEDDAEENDKNSDSDKDKQEEEIKKDEISQRRVYSLEGAKEPISIYTRRVMDISKIGNYLNRNSTRGRCGGRNLDNTCFMNSSIACLSNTTELTYYFLKGDYKKDINEENPLGMYGQLAKAWGELLYEYWVENTSVGNPSSFKNIIGSKAEEFWGYGQQDSHKFISVFLSYLNEDLNRTTKKQYIEMKEKQDDETDEICAKRYWQCNLKRNDSIITDLFYGQYKSTITCPDCNWIKITFDPFDSITLPLLTQERKIDSYYNRTIEEFKFFYITKYGLRNPYCILAKTVEENELLKSLIDRIKKEDKFLYHDKLENLLIVDILRKMKYGYAKEDETLRKYNYSEEYLFAYNYNEEKDGKIKILMYLFEKDNEESKSEYPRFIFVNNEDTLETLRKKIYCYLRKYILSPFLKENEEKDSLSLEIEKYFGDIENKLDENKLIELIESEYDEIFKFSEEDFNNEEKKKEENKDEEKENEKKDNDEDEDKQYSDDDEDKNEEKEKDRDNVDIDREKKDDEE